jgi:uncharacterized membrane protein (UPF0127 family)
MRYKNLIIIILFLSFGFYSLQGCNKKDDNAEWKVKDPREDVNKHPEPPFKKEGDLTFLKKDGKEVKKIDIEIADNGPERQQGLMWRKTMPESQGMLFIFPEMDQQAFWMKNTIIPLDIIYADDKKEVTKIYKNTTPYSEKSLPSEKKAIYVIETVAGFCDKFGIAEGDKISYNSFIK